MATDQTQRSRVAVAGGLVHAPSAHYVRDFDNRPEASMMNVSHLTGAHPSVEYSWRAPSPPHIYVPQPRDDEMLTLPAFKALGYTPEETEILHKITSENQWVDKAKEWKYVWRRDAQSILSFLQLGPSAAARDLITLRRDGVTMLLVIRSTMSAQASLLNGDKAARELGIESAAVDVASNSELIAAFPRACRIINDHLIRRYRQSIANGVASQQPCGKVLVFCESGNERSAAFVCAYLMNIYGLDLVPALQYVQSQRFCVAFDDGIKYMLNAYQDILTATRQLSQSAPAVFSAAPAKVKRRRDEVENDDVDMDMDQGDDEARFGGRTAFVPFRD